ncbi:MAG TPA: hypothetical protein VHX61_08840 [Rhizomicrobium sp.]|jgi:hypothetical protein|nr:hypothetical protein [Rhizomicrobium sp.]
MSKVLLLAAASVFSLAAGAASATQPPARSFVGSFHQFRIPKGAGLLYNQNSNGTDEAINSQNFTSVGTFSPGYDQGADDFVVPKGKTWTITEVDVSGIYYNGSGPAASEDVIFYKDRKGETGETVKHGTFDSLKGTDDGGSFAIKLPGKGLALEAGAYWVSVVANCTFLQCDEWAWDVNGVQRGNQAMWRQPGGRLCPNWGTLEECFSTSGDLMFDLRGTARRKKE